MVIFHQQSEEFPPSPPLIRRSRLFKKSDSASDIRVLVTLTERCFAVIDINQALKDDGARIQPAVDSMNGDAYRCLIVTKTRNLGERPDYMEGTKYEYSRWARDYYL